MSKPKKKPKPSTLGQQIKDAKKDWAKLTKEKQLVLRGVVLEGSSEPTHGSAGRKHPLWTPEN